MTKIEKVGDNFRLTHNGKQIGKSSKDFKKLCCEINHNKVEVENLHVIPESYHRYLNIKQELQKFCDVVTDMRVDEILLTSGFSNPSLIS